MLNYQYILLQNLINSAPELGRKLLLWQSISWNYVLISNPSMFCQWVQCSKCDAWQHQICALFNGRRNQANVEYTCVTCFLKEIENGKCKSLAPVKVLGARDLPRTMLSDHIEKWLFTRLEIEREERATNLGKNIEEVGALFFISTIWSLTHRRSFLVPRIINL